MRVKGVKAPVLEAIVEPRRRRSAAARADRFDAQRSTSPRAIDQTPLEAALSPLAVGVRERVRANLRSPKAAAAAIEEALAGTADGADLGARLRALGFVAVSGGKYRLGKLSLEVKERSLADLRAFELDLDGPRGFSKKSVLVAGAIIDKKLYKKTRDRLEHTVHSFERTLERRGGADLPATLDHLKAFIEAGEKKSVRKKEREHEKELARKLDEIVHALEKLRDTGGFPEGIIIYVDGPDGAGKSSTGGILLEALARAGFLGRSEVFKAPTEEEKKQPWIDRFRRGVPAHGEAVYWDRGPAGDAVYGNPSARKLAGMVRALGQFDAELESKNILQFRVELSADREKQAETMGKRLGRRVIAGRIEELLEGRGRLTPENRESLERIKGKIDPDDFRALSKFKETQSRFLDFARRTGGEESWNLIDATRRHHARMKICDRFLAAIEAFAERRAE